MKSYYRNPNRHRTEDVECNKEHGHTGEELDIAKRPLGENSAKKMVDLGSYRPEQSSLFDNPECREQNR